MECGQLSTIPDELLQGVALQTSAVILPTVRNESGRASRGLHRGETVDNKSKRSFSGTAVLQGSLPSALMCDLFFIH